MEREGIVIQGGERGGVCEGGVLVGGCMGGSIVMQGGVRGGWREGESSYKEEREEGGGRHTRRREGEGNQYRHTHVVSTKDYE